MLLTSVVGQDWPQSNISPYSFMCVSSFRPDIVSSPSDSVPLIYYIESVRKLVPALYDTRDKHKQAYHSLNALHVQLAVKDVISAEASFKEQVEKTRW